MESHRLILERGPQDAEWLLEWDESVLRLKTPDGELVLEADRRAALRILDLYELYGEGKISFASPTGAITFGRQPAALVAARQLVEAGLAADTDFRTELRRRSSRAISLGLIMFVVAGGLFGLYCWWAFTAGDPPPGTWPRWALETFGWAIHGVLLILLAAALAGPVVSIFGLRQWLLVRRIERSAAEAGEKG